MNSLAADKKLARTLKISLDALACYQGLERGPAHADELAARGYCQGSRFEVLRACQELSKRNLIERSDEHGGRWIRVAGAAR